MRRIIGIYGASGFGLEVGSWAREQAEKIVYIDDNKREFPPNVENWLPGAPKIVRSVPEELRKFNGNVVVAVADSNVRKRLSEDVMAITGTRPLSLISRSAQVGWGVTVGAGSVICPFTTLTACASIGVGFQCNIYSYVAHDAVIGDYVTFAPRVACNGNVVIGDHAYIGTGALLKQGTTAKPLKIGRGAIVGMGAVVTKDVEDGAVVVGNPARPLKSQQ